MIYLVEAMDKMSDGCSFDCQEFDCDCFGTQCIGYVTDPCGVDCSEFCGGQICYPIQLLPAGTQN